MLFFLSLISIGLERCLGEYLMTFSVKYLQWTKFQGATVTFVFLGSFTLGCALGIFLIEKLHPTVLLLVDFSVCIVFSVILAALITLHDVVLWVCSAGIGLGASSIFATIFTWTERYVGVNARVSSVVVVGNGVADMVSPAITGALMDKVDLVAFVFVVLGFCVSGMVVMLLLVKMSRTTKKYDITGDALQVSLDDTELKE